MKKQKLKQWFYHIRTQYVTVNNAILCAGLAIGIAWAWGSLQMVSRNYTLQKNLDYDRRQLVLAQLDVGNMKLEQKYYQTDEYLEIAAKENLGLVNKGEKILVLPDNSDAAKREAAANSTNVTTVVVAESNFEQWINFLTGRNL